MRRILSLIGFAGIIILFVALDTSFFPAISDRSGLMNSTLAFAVYLVVIFNRKIAVVFYVSTIVLMSLISSELLMIPLLLGLGVLFLLDQLLTTYFTNRSYYSVIALSALAWIAYYALFALLIVSANIFTADLILPELHFSWFLGVFLTIIPVIILVSAAYLATSFASKRFQSYFIIHDR
jgi:hypothetical protein